MKPSNLTKAAPNNLAKAVLLCALAVSLLCVEANAFGKLLKIGREGIDAQASSLSTFIRGRYARTVITDTFAGFTWQRCLYGVCVPTYAAVTTVRVFTGGVWKSLTLDTSSFMWSPGRVGSRDYQLELFSWLKEKRRDYCVFEFATASTIGPVVVETTYEEVIPMYGNKWAYRVPFGWNVGGGSCAVNTWTIDVESDENYSQPRITPIMPGITIEGKRMYGSVTKSISAGEPIIDCVEHPDHSNTTIRDEYRGAKHVGVFVTPVATGAATSRRTVSIVMPPGLTSPDGPAQARLLFDALLARLGPNDFVNVWSNSSTMQRLWKNPQRAHADNVFAIMSLLDNQIHGNPLPSVDKILDSTVVHDANDSTQHEIVILTHVVTPEAVARVPRSTPISVVAISNGLPSSSLHGELLLRGGTYQHAAWWYGWRSLIPSIADSCLGIPLATVGSTTPTRFSPEPPTNTFLVQGSRRVVYSYDDGRPAKSVHPAFQGILARTWANERVNRLVNSIHGGVSATVQAEYIAEIHRIGTTYQLWTPYSPFIEAP